MVDKLDSIDQQRIIHELWVIQLLIENASSKDAGGDEREAYLDKAETLLQDLLESF